MPVTNPTDDDMRPKPGISWAIWIVGGAGLLFVVVYAVGGCMMHTIC
jgi:hypothetical protein